MGGALSDERMGLSFTIAAGPCQRSHSRVRFPWDSWPYFTFSGSRLPQPGGGPIESALQGRLYSASISIVDSSYPRKRFV
jgi:hypothetical protein